MNNKPTLPEVLKQFSGWIKGGVALLTSLIGFAILFRDNPQLTAISIIVTLSISIMFVCVWVIIAKKSPGFIGGRDIPIYSKPLRVTAFLVLLLIWFFNILFFISSTGKQVASAAFNGANIVILTNTMAPTSTFEDFSVPSPTETPPSTDRLVKANFYSANPCVIARIIPNDIEVKGTPLDMAKYLYERDDLLLNESDFLSYTNEFSWLNWEEYPKWASIMAQVYNIQTEGSPWIKIENTAEMVIDSYEPLPSMGAAYFFPNEICGGEGATRDFPSVFLSEFERISSKITDIDFFTLQPGEFEFFDFEIGCEKPGKYEYHIELTASSLGGSSKISSQSFTLYCPKTLLIWNFEEPLINNQKLEIHGASFSEYSLMGRGKYEEKSSKVIVEPWKPCEDAPDSYIFPPFDLYGMSITVNPNLKTTLSLQSDAGLDAPFLETLTPGQRFGVTGVPKCADGMVWWNVQWSVYQEPNMIDHDGWVPESDGTDRFLVSCFENPDCNTSGE